ncbi:MAG: DUF1330 domain-containing protein [Candidatus Pseudomonas phytovorans]|uniref:DUF1330 domain-containing protein n=1 Tax=Candidatus Pseudomonas phytovorans TaxID=3121377 RepID=A0AAJ5WLI3_9PSED|nr:DUF1330 domain-containing protein [Pseudomonas sp.]WEK32875.1 MAG: DUF1330 domain-containing protein [Pseudomonas sp.]
MMKGYWIIFGADVVDADAQQEYSRLWAPISDKYMAKIKVLEPGALVEFHSSTRVLIVEFPSYEQARACYNDPAYADAKQFATRASRREMVIIEGDLA